VEAQPSVAEIETEHFHLAVEADVLRRQERARDAIELTPGFGRSMARSSIHAPSGRRRVAVLSPCRR
jgi:hypothetical protein